MKKSMVVWVTDEMEMEKLMERFGITEDDVEGCETHLDGSIDYAISVEESIIPEIKEYQAMKLMEKIERRAEELMEWVTEQLKNTEAKKTKRLL